MGTRYRRSTFALEAVFVLIALVFSFPIYVLVVMAFKSPEEATSSPLSLPDRLGLENFTAAWENASLGQAFLNSVVITVVSVVILIVFGSLASYTLARRFSRLSSGVYLLFLLGIMLPFQMAVIPLYRMIHDLGLIGTWTSVILFYSGLLMPMTIFLYTGFLRALPTDYEEAARIDGASRLQTFWRVVFPLLRAVTGTVVILNGVAVWNDFFTPLLFLGGTDQQTVPVAVYSFVGQYVSEWNLIFAALLLALLPVLIVYFLLQRSIIKGFSGGIRA